MAADFLGLAHLPAFVFAAGDSDCRPNPPLLIHSTVSGKVSKSDYMDNIDNIFGREIQTIKLLTWSDSDYQTIIEKVLIDFGSCKLIFEVDSDYDTIKTSLLKDFNLKAKEKEHKIIESSVDNDFVLRDLLGKKIIWLWRLTNNLGYQDGIQIELDGLNTFQFLVEASSIEIKKILNVKLPSR